ncbi:MAG: rRNA biogenesis protein rrp5 [Thelocarpon impressellum]|nr:MAG: rRNA biogenesis protein rrp5 [Thelocarpon impressellum]
MAPIKRKGGGGDAPLSAGSRARPSDDRPQKKQKKSRDGTANTAGVPSVVSKSSTSAKSGTKLSSLRAEEPAFPRGGASVLTPLEHKQIKIDATRDVLFEQSGSKKRGEASEDVGFEDTGSTAKLVSGKKKLKSKAKKGQSLVEPEDSGVRIEGLSYKRLVPGSLVLGQVFQITANDVALALPNNLTGYVPLTSMSSGITGRLEALVERENEESDEEVEDGDPSKDDDIDLKALFSLGQYLRARVSSTSDESSTNGVAKRKRRIELSVDPKQVNAGLSKAELVANNMIQASVVSVEDHGMVMDLGLADASVRGFMSSREVGYGVSPASIEKGAVFLCHVIGQNSSGSIVKLSADPQRVLNIKKAKFLADAPTIDAFLPGTPVEILVAEVTGSGMAGKVMGMVDVTADIMHSGAGTDPKWEKKLKVGQKIKARVICTFPTAEPRKLGVSTLEHIVSLSSTKALQGEEKVDPITALPLSTILQEAKIVRVVSDVGLFLDVGVTGIPGFVHISRIADKKVDTLVESSGPYKLDSVHRARIIGYNPMDGLYLASMEESTLNQPFLRIEDIKVGEVVKGAVDKIIINPKGVGGVLIKLADGIAGLVPEIHMADVKLSHPEKKFRDGISVTARVLSTDPGKRQFRLTLKKTLVNSEAMIFKSYEDISVASQSPGTIVKILPAGAVVQFYGPVRAFLPVSEMSETYIQDPSQHFRIGQVVSVHVLSVDAESQKMVVSCRDRAGLDSERAVALNELRLGSTVDGKVIEKSSDDVTVELAESGLKGIVALGHLTDGSEQKNLSALKRIRVNQTLRNLVVLQKSENKRTITLSNKPTLVADAKASKLIKSFDEVREGVTVNGFVNNVTSTGVFIQFAAGLTGLLLKRDMSGEALQLPDFGMRRHQSLSASILSVDHAQRRFLLSMKGPSTLEARQTNISSSGLMPENPVDGAIASLENLALGKVTKARITSIKETQINVQLADNIQGRIDVSAVFDSWDEIKDRKHPLRSFKTKSIISVRILGIHDARNHRFLPITHRVGRVPVFELSAKPSDQTETASQILTLDKVKVGSSWLAFINNISDDCIWVNISPNVRGRLRHLDVSDDVILLRDLEKNFPVGSALKVHVKNVDVDANRLDLSARSPSSLSGSGFTSLAKGMVIPARVTKVTERQIVVQLNETVSGPVGLTDLSDDYSTANPTTYSKNEIVRVCVTDLDVPNKRVLLSTRPSKVLDSSLPVKDREISSLSQAKVNDIVRGFVKNVADNGIFVSLGSQVTAYVRVSDLSDSFIKDWKSNFQVDQLVQGKIISVDPLLNHVQMSLKRSIVDKDYVSPVIFNDVKVGQIVTGKVRKVEDFGVFIVVDGSANVSGLCHRSEIADERVEDVRTLYDEGDVVKARVLKVEPDKRRISFGLKASYFDGAGEENEEDESDEGDGESDVEDVMEADGDGDEDGDEDMDDGGVDLGDVQDFDEVVEEEVMDEGGQPRPSGSAGLSTHGFDWTASNLDEGTKRSQSESENERVDKPKRKKRRPEIREDRTGDLDAYGPQSGEDFERLLLGQPDSSSLWLQYMAFQLQLSEVAKARETAERALKTISITEETEKMNVWIGLLNLENTYGSDATVEEVFHRATHYNDPQEIHERLASIYIQSGKHDQATALFQTMSKKFSQSPRVWQNHATYLMQTLSQPAMARALLPRALQALPPHAHIATTTKFAALEFRSPAGDAERGRTLFEGLLASFPRRWDLWNVFLDLEMAGGDAEAVRALFKRTVAAKGLKGKTARAFFKRWVAFEEGLSREGNVADVQARAAEWVRSAKGEEGGVA